MRINIYARAEEADSIMALKGVHSVVQQLASCTCILDRISSPVMVHPSKKM